MPSPPAEALEHATEEGGVEGLEAGGAVEEGLLPLAVVLDGGVAALYAPLQLTPALVTLGQQ